MAEAPPSSEAKEVKYNADNLPAAFWDEYPEHPEDNVDLAAINALLEECTPDERAETYKVRLPSEKMEAQTMLRPVSL